MKTPIKCDICKVKSNTTKPISGLDICYSCRMIQKDAPILEHICKGEYDDMSCVCGNQTHLEGFYPCLESGESVEPDVGSGWINLFKCDKCGQIIRDLTIDISDSTTAKKVSTLKPYNKDAKCPKCGFGFITSKYTTEEWNEELYWAEECEPHIARTCCNCGFAWKEIPLDRGK